jgi:hypothetical protein
VWGTGSTCVALRVLVTVALAGCVPVFYLAPVVVHVHLGGAGGVGLRAHTTLFEPSGGRTRCSIRGTVTKGAVGTFATLVAIEPGGGHTPCSFLRTVACIMIGTGGTCGAVEPLVLVSAFYCRSAVAFVYVGTLLARVTIEPGVDVDELLDDAKAALRVTLASPLACFVPVVHVPAQPPVRFHLGEAGGVGHHAQTSAVNWLGGGRTVFIRSAVTDEAFGTLLAQTTIEPGGGHTVFIRGTVTDGVWGTPLAQTTVEPGGGHTVCSIRGTVTDGVWGTGSTYATVEPDVDVDELWDGAIAALRVIVAEGLALFVPVVGRAPGAGRAHLGGAGVVGLRAQTSAVNCLDGGSTVCPIRGTVAVGEVGTLLARVTVEPGVDVDELLDGAKAALRVIVAEGLALFVPVVGRAPGAVRAHLGGAGGDGIHAQTSAVNWLDGGSTVFIRGTVAVGEVGTGGTRVTIEPGGGHTVFIRGTVAVGEVGAGSTYVLWYTLRVLVAEALAGCVPVVGRAPGVVRVHLGGTGGVGLRAQTTLVEPSGGRTR